MSRVVNHPGEEYSKVLKTAVCLTCSSNMREAGVNRKECDQKESRACVWSLVILVKIFLVSTLSTIRNLGRVLSRGVGLIWPRLQQKSLCLLC